MTQPQTRPATAATAATATLPEFPQLSPAELADLSREAGRQLNNEEGHHFRREKIRQQEADRFVYGRKAE